MTLILYNTLDDDIVVNKRLYQVYPPMECVFKDGGEDISSPTIQLNSFYHTNYNYAYIPELHRYYYVTNITIDACVLVTISLRVDVLMSYKENIKESIQFVDRNQYIYNPSLVDGKLLQENREEVHTEEITLTDMHFIKLPFEYDGGGIPTYYSCFVIGCPENSGTII